jgi:hypothetical protein
MSEGKMIMRRVYGFLAALLCFGLVSFVLVGCFFDGDDGGESTDTTAGTTVPSDGSTTSEDPSATDSTSSTTEGPVLVNGLPREYVESLGMRPIVVIFYVPGGIDDEKVLKSVRESQTVYGNYTFLVFDYRTPNRYGDLAQELGVDYPPHVVLIDRNGVVRTVWSGFVDKATLNQTLLTLGRY